jgi:hypothetical protein
MKTQEDMDINFHKTMAIPTSTFSLKNRLKKRNEKYRDKTFQKYCKKNH